MPEQPDTSIWVAGVKPALDLTIANFYLRFWLWFILVNSLSMDFTIWEVVTNVIHALIKKKSWIH